MNLVSNPSFEEDEVILDDPDWYQWCTWNTAEGAGSNATIVDTESIDGTRSIRIEPKGAKYWHFILVYRSFPANLDKNYTASFWAKAEAPRPLTVQMKAADNSVEAWGATFFELTTEWTEYTYTSEILHANVTLEILCAGSEVPFWLDLVSVYEEAPLVINGSFEEDEVILDDQDYAQWWTLGWENGLDSTVEIDEAKYIDGTRSLRVDPIGSVNWYFIVANSPIPLEVGTNYTASFWAKAEAPRSLTVQMKATDNSIDWGWTDFELTSEWAEYAFTSEALNTEGKLEFHCAGSEVTLWLDFVSVYEGEYAVGFLPGGAVTGLIEDFDDGQLNNWWFKLRTYSYAPDKRSGSLRIDYHRTEASGLYDGFMFTPPYPVDVSEFPFISVKAKSNVTTLLSFDPKYHGREGDRLQAILPDDNYWHTYVFELEAAGDGPLNAIYTQFDEGSDIPNSGTIYFDDLRIGDQVIIEIFTSELEQWIQCATTLYENSEEGTEEGQYLIGSREILKSAIDNAQEVFDLESPTQQQLDMAAADLVEAGTAFQDGIVIKDLSPANINNQIDGVELTFGVPIKVPNVNTSETGELDPHISTDGLELYFRGSYPGFNWDLFVATRPTTHHLWEERQRLVGVNDYCHVEGPCTSSDGLTLYFSGSSSVGGTDYFRHDISEANRYDIWTSTRPTAIGRMWSKPVKFGPPVSTPTYAEWWPSISTDDLELYFTRSNNTAPGFFIDLYMSTRPTTQDPWGWPVRLPQPINGSGDHDYDSNPCISADGCMLYFNSTRKENGHFTEDGRPITTKDIWVTTRPTTSDPWSEPVNIGAPVNTAEMEYGPGVSADGRWLFFSRYEIYAGPGFSDIWQVEINPVVDFNGD